MFNKKLTALASTFLADLVTQGHFDSILPNT